MYIRATLVVVVGRDQRRDNRPMARDPHLLDVRFALAANNDLLAHDLRALPLALELIARWVGWVEPLNVNILHIGHGVGHAPCDPLIMADDNTWRTRQTHAGHGVVAAVEMHLVPE